MALCLTACSRDSAADADVEAAGAASDAAEDTAEDTGSSTPDGDPDDGGVADAAPGPNACRNAGTGGATAACLTPTQTPEYYVEQAEKYFDTLDVDAPADSIPNYSELVARWEWPPWLLLTGYGRDVMISTAEGLREVDPSTVPERDCRFFEVQPFARCRVVFEYEEGPCPIYEEFVFNDAGEMTFIEAWSDLPGMLPTGDDDPWAEAPDAGRLSTRVPGLGNAEGRIDLDSEWMLAAVGDDADVADFVERAGDFWGTWFAELEAADDDFFAHGCGW